MPKRVISPVHVSRDTLAEQLHLQDDLEGVTNGTLSNIIRQLSSLSRHAEDVFGELYKEAEGLHARSSNLQARVDRLAVKVTQLDSTVEEVSLQDIHLRKAFRSSTVFDQQVVSKQTIPTAMSDTYHQCDRPPPLEKLNVYRYLLLLFIIIINSISIILTGVSTSSFSGSENLSQITIHMTEAAAAEIVLK